MQNNQTITIVITVDVDRKSPAYSRGAVQALDPTRRGPSDSPSQTIKDADLDISRTVALAVTKQLLGRKLPPDYGATTVRVKSPKNVKESLRTDPEDIDRWGEKGDAL